MKKNKKSLFFTLGRSQTGDPWIKSPTLYLLSYEGSNSQFKSPSGSRTDSFESYPDPPHICCTPYGNLCGWFRCAECSLRPGVGWCGTGWCVWCGVRPRGCAPHPRRFGAAHCNWAAPLLGSWARTPTLCRWPCALGLVSVVLGPCQPELHDGIALPEFVLELAQVLAQGRTGLTETVCKHHRIDVKVEDLFSQQL